MFWSKKAPPTEAPITTIPRETERRLERAEADLDASLEATAGVLRALAKHSFALGDEPAETIGKRFETWATHILVLGPLPDEADGQRPVRREWAKLVRFVAGHRKAEEEHVVGSLTAMREAIATMLQCFGAASIGQGKSDRTVTERIERLRSTVETGSLDQLRAEALAVTEAVTRALEEQRQRTREQTELLRARLDVLRERLDEAQREGETDPLTKLFNRRAFDASIDRTSVMASVMGRPMSLVLIDIDHFKLVNDRHGHPAGDIVLREFANVLTRCFPRRSDVVARYGGEEFAIILTETSAKDAQRLATRFLEAVRALRIECGDRTLNVTASAGIGQLAEGESAADLLTRTDLALYRAKNAGRDCVVDAAATRPSGPVRLDQALTARHRAAG